MLQTKVYLYHENNIQYLTTSKELVIKDIDVRICERFASVQTPPSLPQLQELWTEIVTTNGMPPDVKLAGQEYIKFDAGMEAFDKDGVKTAINATAGAVSLLLVVKGIMWKDGGEYRLLMRVKQIKCSDKTGICRL